MTGLLVIGLAGFAGSFHCVGMCGGFVCALGARRGDSGRRALAYHLVYNAGRLVTYVFIGALAGSLGSTAVGAAAHGHTPGASALFADDLGALQRVLSVVAGALMLLMALQLSGRIGWLSGARSAVVADRLASTLRILLTSSKRAAPLALGVANGFLPCPLVYAFAAMAAATGSALAGMTVMAAFGLGTFPAMLMMGSVGRALSPVARRRGVRVAAVFVGALGSLTVVRGLAPALLHWPGHGA